MITVTEAKPGLRCTFCHSAAPLDVGHEGYRYGLCLECAGALKAGLPEPDEAEAKRLAADIVTESERLARALRACSRLVSTEDRELYRSRAERIVELVAELHLAALGGHSAHD